MRIIRSLAYNSFFWVGTPLWILLIMTPLSFLKSPAPMRKAITLWIDFALNLLEGIGGIKVEERGLENIPKDQGFILCFKHMSNLDALIAYRRLPNLTAIAKIQLFRVPGLKQVLTKMKVLPVDRGAGSAQNNTPALVKLLVEDKMPLLLFVEGTRIKVGKRKKLKSGAYFLQKDTGLPVICASTNAGIFWTKGSPFNRLGTIIVNYHPALAKDLDKDDFMQKIKENVVIDSERLMGIAFEGEEE